MLCIAIFSIIIGLSIADKCPPSPPLTQNIDYEEIKGEWILAGSRPEFDEKCKNLTFSENNKSEFQLYEDLFESTENWRKETNTYDITKGRNSPSMVLANVSSHDKVKLFLVDGDYSTYIIFYSCDDSSGTASEAWEIWSRGIKYEPTNLPRSIVNTLGRLNFKPTDFSYRTTSDCTV